LANIFYQYGTNIGQIANISINMVQI